MNPATARPIFANAAARVVRRLAFNAWCRALSRTAVPVFAVALAGWIVLRRAGVQDRAWWAFALIAAWLALSALIAWLRRPAPFAALAAWDRSADAREMFASAWFFENDRTRTPGVELHLARAHAHLPKRLARLARDLPVRLTPRAWLAPLLFAAFAITGWLRLPISTEDRGLTAEARARAAEVGTELAERTKILDPLKSLSDEEKEKLKHLRAEMEQTAKKLDRMATPRDLLEELERRARDTEKLAEALRSEDLGALSAAFLSELEHNADTADLGNALRAGDLGNAAEEARLLEARLGQKKPTLEEQKRLEEALKRALEAANKKDRDSKTGKSLEEARKQLAAGNSSQAAKQFGDLSQHFGSAAQRQQAQEQLRNLAQNFRGAGQQILGGKNLQRLTPQAPSGSQPLAGIPLLAPGTGHPGQPQGAMPMPGTGNNPPMAMIPIPGANSGLPNGAMPFPIPGSGSKPGGGMPMPGAGQNPGAGGFPVPGLGSIPGAGGAMAGGDGGEIGGSEAGNGTAPLGADPTKLAQANQTGTVAPAPGAEGPSAVRAVEAAAHREAPARSRQEIAVEFLKTEEAALAEEPLPLSRRAQVLRYFTAIRQQLENQP